MRKVVVTGAAGGVGMNLLSVLDRGRYELVAIDRREPGLSLVRRLFPEVRAEAADLSAEGPWADLLEGASCVVQLQARLSSTRREDYVADNVRSVRNVLAACGRHRVGHLVHVSSTVLLTRADDDYRRTKEQGESLVRAGPVPHTVLRPTLMYGCFDSSHLGFIERVLESFPVVPVPGSGLHVRQPLFLEDFARVLAACIEREPRGEVLTVAGRERLPFIGMLRTLAEEKGLRVLLVPIPVPLFSLMLRAYNGLLGGSEVVPHQLASLTAGDVFPFTDWGEEFGVEPTPFREGVRRMLASPYHGLGR